MTAIEQIYYEQSKRRQLYNMYQYHAMKMQQLQYRIANLKYAMKAGIDVEHDPEYRDEYLAIMTELGPIFFVFEDNNHKVIKKEEKK